MATNVEISRNLFDSELTNDPTSILFLEGFLGHFILFHLIRFSQEFKITGVDVGSLRIKSVFLD